MLSSAMQQSCQEACSRSHPVQLGASGKHRGCKASPKLMQLNVLEPRQAAVSSHHFTSYSPAWGLCLPWPAHPKGRLLFSIGQNTCCVNLTKTGLSPPCKSTACVRVCYCSYKAEGQRAGFSHCTSSSGAWCWAPRAVGRLSFSVISYSAPHRCV